jgi:hypothetical protein
MINLLLYRRFGNHDAPGKENPPPNSSPYLDKQLTCWIALTLAGVLTGEFLPTI